MTPSRDPRTPRKSTVSIQALAVCLVVILALGSIIVYLLSTRPAPDQAGGNSTAGGTNSGLAPPLAATGLSSQAGLGEKPAPGLDVEDERFWIEDPAQKRPGETAGQESILALPPDQDQARAVLDDRIHGFLTHLDGQEYMAPSLQGGGSGPYFEQLFAKILDNPPVVARETDDLYTVLKNTAHFFRVIGKDNVVLLKTILDREQGAVEEIAAALYRRTELGDSEGTALHLDLPLEQLYEYAGFFLHTIGGRAYLFRRNSRSRLLVNYYSLLVLDRANVQGLNHHGLDPGPFIPLLRDEIRATNQLEHKQVYLDRLAELEEKYPR